MSSGLLFVYMTPSSTLPLTTFHDWYNNEHGPTRLRLPHMFRNGLRYTKSPASTGPPFLAIYDITDMNYMLSPTYTQLRENRSEREAAVIGQMEVDRRFYDLVEEDKRDCFVEAEKLGGEEGHGRVLVIEQVNGPEEAGRKWLQASTEQRKRESGWLRTRWFRTSTVQDKPGIPIELLALHEYEPNSKPEPLISELPELTINSHTMTLFYIFGPSPRELESLTPASTSPFTDSVLTTTTGPTPSITCQLSTPNILYRLEGNPSPNAPTIAFCNSLLTSLHMWDPFVTLLLKHRPDLRILRYNHRGRSTLSSAVSADDLTDDLASLLSTLRISKLDCLIGVSLGGVTAQNFVIRYPGRLSRYVACDFNAVSSPANAAAWRERVAMADREGGRGFIDELVPLTVSRWFSEESMQKTSIVKWMEAMVAENDQEGFRWGCRALWEYDLREGMKQCLVPVLYVAGEHDAGGKFLRIMKDYEEVVGYEKAEFRMVKGTGHLPMVEDVEAFWLAVEDFVLGQE